MTKITPRQPHATAVNAIAVTPSDTVGLGKPTSGLYIGVTGDVKVLFANDTVPVVLKSCPVGKIDIRVVQVFAGSTTATNIVALF